MAIPNLQHHVNYAHYVACFPSSRDHPLPGTTIAASSQEITLYAIAPQNPAQNPSTMKPSMKDPTSANNIPFITKINRPSVSNVTGSVNTHNHDDEIH